MMIYFKPLLIFLVVSLPLYACQTEYGCNKQFCKSINGSREVRYKYGDEGNYIVADCVTTRNIYEGGLDKHSSMDSIVQALSAQGVTGKTGVVVIYDTDGKEGIYEQWIRKHSQLVGVEYISYPCK